MRREAWKMFFANLLPPFYGSFFSVFQMARAYTAGAFDPRFPELVGANALAKKGRWQDAEEVYQRILDREGDHAGLRYNIALACARAHEWEQCLERLDAIFEDCSNYLPGANLMFEALQRLQGLPEAQAYSARWGRPASTELHRQQANSPASSEQIQVCAPNYVRSKTSGEIIDQRRSFESPP